MAGNTTSLYSTTTSNGTTGSNNFTTLYPNAQGAIIPTTPYGNANVVALLNAGSDGGNTVGNITATGNVVTGNLIAEYIYGNIVGNLVVPGATGQVLFNNAGNAAASADLVFNSGNAELSVTGAVSTPTVYSQGMATQGYDFVQMQYSNSVALPVSQYDLGTGSWFYLDAGGATFQSNTTGTFKQVVLGNDSSISATGNISGNYFIGNGSQLTGIIASAGAAITNGNSNVTVAANSNITMGVAGVSNVVVVATTGEYVAGVVSATGNITGNYILGNGAFLTGIVTSTYGNANVSNFLANGFGSNTISTTGNISAGNILLGDLVGAGNVTATGNVTGGNIQTTGTVSATGNVTGNYILGNGSQLTGLPATYSNANVATFLANFGSNSISTTGNVTAGNFFGNGAGLTNITGANVTGTVANATYALNANAATYANVVTDNAQPNITSVGTLTSVSVSGNATVGNLLTGGIVSATGNITGNYFIGNGSQLTGISAANVTAAGANTQLQYNNAGAFAGNAGLTFNNSTGNVTLANLIVSPGVAGNATSGNNAVIINTPTAFAGTPATATGLQAGQTVFGNGYFGNLNLNNLIFSTPKGSRVLFWDAANISDGSNVGVRYAGFGATPTVVLQGNLTSTNNFMRGQFTTMQVGGGSAANTYINSVQGINAMGGAGFALVAGQASAAIPVGNTTIGGAVGMSMQMTVYNGSNMGNAVAGQYNFTNSTGNITNAVGIGLQFNGAVNTTPTNVVGMYMGNTVGIAGLTNANAMRAATNYYFLKNDDAVAQTQLGSLRSYNEYRYDTATSGTFNLDKNNAQVQYIAPTANITISGYDSMITSLSDGTNTDQEIDTLTVLVQQGATPYTVTLPTGSTYQYAGNISTVPAVANSRSILTVVAANIAGTVNYFTTVQSDQAVASSYGDANVATFLAAFGSNSISTTGTITSGNITGANILTGGIVSATGNITGNYFIGNGSQLTGISANAAGANTQIQYNDGNAFAGNSLMTFDNTTGNVTLSNLIIGTNSVGNLTAGNAATRINTTDAFSGGALNNNGFLPGQILIGNGFFGNLNINNIQARPAAKFNVWDSANVSEVGGNSLRYQATYGTGMISIGNIANASSLVRGGIGQLAIGGGSSANSWTNTNQGLGAVLAFNQFLAVGQPNTVAALGNVTLQGAGAALGQAFVYAGSNVGNLGGVLSQINNAGNVTTALGMAAYFAGTPTTTPTNVFGYYMPGTTNSYGATNSNGMRQATNYYFLRNDDAVAQNQLGSLRAYHTFQAGGNTTGTWNIDKTNGQVQAISATGNITIGTYTNFVTTANDGTNNDNQTDTVTLIIEQGATPYTVTMPTGNSAIKYANGVSTVTSTANTTTMIAITAFRSAANTTAYLTTISPAFS